jgi:hypothetical protein
MNSVNQPDRSFNPKKDVAKYLLTRQQVLFLLFFCRVSKIGNGFSDVFFCIFQKFQIWCLAAGEVHFDAIVAAVSRLFGLGPRWEDVGR